MPATIAHLRQLLAERFPPSAPRAGGRVLATDLPAIDDLTGGGLPDGALTEIVCAAPSCGSQLLLGQLLRAAREARGRVGLIDAHDSFDPASWSTDLLAHVVWVRCQETAAALQAADVLSRDANFRLVVLDLRYAAPAELRRTPAPFWYRLQRAVEPADRALVVFTPHAAVPSAQLRLQLDQSHPFAALDTPRPTLAATLAPTLQRQRLAATA